MLRLIPSIAILAFTPAMAMTTEQRSGVERLREVNVIYVAELGETFRAKSLRQEIIKELSKSDFIRVVEAPEKADAVLTATIKQVSKNVDNPYEVFGEPGLKTGSKVITTQEIQFRVDSRQHRNLWKAKFDSDSFSSMNESQAVSAMAIKVSERFRKAIEKDTRKHR